MYLGFASELAGIEEENPNLSFDISGVPQAQGATALRSYGTFYGLSIPKTSKNVTGAYQVALKLAGSDMAGDVSKALGLTPVHRALFAGANDDVYGRIFYESALIARGWLDPAPNETDTAFKNMVENITSGRGDANKSVSDAGYILEELFR
jgi:ABC-type glycerol-3-phosphate transport system substrate-binding protein